MFVGVCTYPRHVWFFTISMSFVKASPVPRKRYSTFRLSYLLSPSLRRTNQSARAFEFA